MGGPGPSLPPGVAPCVAESRYDPKPHWFGQPDISVDNEASYNQGHRNEWESE